MNRWLGVGIVVLFAAVICGQGAVATDSGTDGIPAEHEIRSNSAAVVGDQYQIGGSDRVEFDRVQFRIHVYPNGSAQWTFRYERSLEDDEREEFEAFAAEFNEEETELYRDFQRQATELAERGAEETDREMRATGFERNAEIGGLDTIDNTVGIVEMSFVWEEFAEVDDDTVIVGDVFRGGLYIFESQSIVVETDDELYFETVDPEPDTASHEVVEESDTVSWQGETEFNDSRPRVVLAPEDTRETDTISAPGLGDPGDGGDGDSDGGEGNNDGGDESGPWMAVAFGTVVLLGLVAAAAWQRREDDSWPITATESGAEDEETLPADPAPASPAVSDEELLTDEDRVVNLLEENGGRMKQVNIVEETGWSKSKVSMLLSDMEEEGTISKLRVGRENIISLDGEEPEAAGSPLED